LDDGKFPCIDIVRFKVLNKAANSAPQPARKAEKARKA
jgi:hypothetical protein